MSFYDYQKQFADKFNLQHNSGLKYQNGKLYQNGKRKPLENGSENLYSKRMITERFQNNSRNFGAAVPQQLQPQPQQQQQQQQITRITSGNNFSHNLKDSTPNEDEDIPIIDLDDYPDYDEQLGIPSVPLLEVNKHEDIQSFAQNKSIIETNSKSSQTLSAEQGVFSRYLTYSREEIEYFTGLTLNRFELLINLMKRENIKLTQEDMICLHDQLLLTLFRYKHNCEFQLMQFIFKVNHDLCVTIFRECSNALYDALSKINYISTSKRNKGNSIIVDSTYFMVEPTENEKHKQLLMCADDKQQKFKLLLACDDNGLIIFVSDTYGGAMPERELFVKSEFSGKISSGEGVIPCKEFYADNILKLHGIFIKHKGFIGENDDDILKKALAPSTCTKEVNTMKELISNIKENKILSNPIPTEFWPMANKIIKNCFYLNNMRNKALNTIVMLK